MAVKSGVERDLEDRCVVKDQPVRRTLEAQALGVLLQGLADRRPEQAMKVKRREPGQTCQRRKRQILIEVGLDVNENGQEPLHFDCGGFVRLRVVDHFRCVPAFGE